MGTKKNPLFITYKKYVNGRSLRSEVSLVKEQCGWESTAEW